MQKEFYKLIADEVFSDHKSKMLTLIDGGEQLGAKALIRDNELIAYCPEQTKEFWQGIDIGNANNFSLVKLDSNKQIFVEPLLTPPQLVICGGGHISLYLAEVGHIIGFDVTVIDDRLEFANQNRFPQATVICKPFDEALHGIGGENVYFAIVTRGHKHDVDCLRQILDKSHAYIGMIGSRSRVGLVKKQLVEDGYSKDLIESIYSPIGLKIGAETPEEIAICILAEIIQVKNNFIKGSGNDSELWKMIVSESQLPQALITIIKHRGSAPRKSGTKMLVRADGACFGTIGGGCVEGEAKKRAIDVINKGKAITMLVDMTGNEAEDEGMVCGGMVTLLIEPL